MHEELYKKSQSKEEAFSRFCAVVEALRSDKGCPWDRAQTHESLRRWMIEEAYELVEAINRKDRENIIEELGDVLLQVLMHSKIGDEMGDFSIMDVLEFGSEKMLRRHPHVFAVNVENCADNETLSVDNVLELWENVKSKEKAESSITSSMEAIPAQLPALLKSEKIQRKAAKVGFDWPDMSGAFDKLEEELEELKLAVKEEDSGHIKEELGDLLFAVTNVARFLDIDPEEALNGTSSKFIDRFDYVERKAARSGRRLEDMSLAEMDELWEQAKKKEQLNSIEVRRKK